MKRLFDILLAVTLLVVLAPCLIVLIILIRLESPGCAVFRQPRVGCQGKMFTLYKLRTMRNGAPLMPANQLDDRDQYILRTGKFIRNFSLDELLQLYNILKGDMSFVGPRPVIADEKELIEARRKLGVYGLKPGLTGWAQINGRNRVTPLEKAEMDAYYLHHKSTFFDLYIMFKTMVKVLSKDGIIEHGTEFNDRVGSQNSSR